MAAAKTWPQHADLVSDLSESADVYWLVRRTATSCDPPFGHARLDGWDEHNRLLRQIPLFNTWNKASSVKLFTYSADKYVEKRMNTG